MADKDNGSSDAQVNHGRATAPRDTNGKSDADLSANRKADAPKKSGATTTMYFTKDGTPVEPSTIPAKAEVGELDSSKRPDVIEKQVPVEDARTHKPLNQ